MFKIEALNRKGNIKKKKKKNNKSCINNSHTKLTAQSNRQKHGDLSFTLIEF